MPKLSRATQESSVYSGSKALLMVLVKELVDARIVGVGFVTKLDVLNTNVDPVMEVSLSSVEFRQSQSFSKSGHCITSALLYVSGIGQMGCGSGSGFFFGTG